MDVLYIVFPTHLITEVVDDRQMVCQKAYVEQWSIFVKKTVCSNLLSNSNCLLKMTFCHIEMFNNKIATHF